MSFQNRADENLKAYVKDAKGENNKGEPPASPMRYDIFELKPEGESMPQKLKVNIYLPGIQKPTNIDIKASDSMVVVKMGGDDVKIKLPYKVIPREAQAMFWNEHASVILNIDKHIPPE